MKKSKGIVLAGLLAIAGNTVMADEIDNMAPENFEGATETVTIDVPSENNEVFDFITNSKMKKKKTEKEPELNTDIKFNHNNVLFYLKPINEEEPISFDELYKSGKSVGAYRAFSSETSNFTNLSILSIDMHGHKNKAVDIAGESIEETLDNYGLDGFGYKVLMNNTFSNPEEESFHKVHVKGGLDYNHINLGSKQIKSIQFDMWDMNTTMDKESMNMIPYMVYLHELAHTHDHQEKFLRDVFNGESEDFELHDDPLKNREVMELNTLAGENYADSFALIMSAKLALYEHGKDDAGIYRGVTDKASKIVAESGDAWADFRKDTMGKKKEKFDDHLTFLTVKTTNDFIEKNKDVLCSFTEKEVQQMSAMIANRTLNHKFTHKIRSKKDDKTSIAELYAERISKDVGKEVQKMIKLGLDDNNVPSADFSYNPKKYSKILQKKNIDTNSISPSR